MYFTQRMENNENFTNREDANAYNTSDEEDEDFVDCNDVEDDRIHSRSNDNDSGYCKSSLDVPNTFQTERHGNELSIAPVPSSTNPVSPEDECLPSTSAPESVDDCESFAMQLIYNSLNFIGFSSPEPSFEDDSVSDPEHSDSLNLNLASREALFDPDSQLEMPDVCNLEDDGEMSDDPVLIGVHLNPEDINPEDPSPFPDWLIHLFEQQNDDDEENHDEPHFYCQGDGLGVHPSVIEMNDTDESSSESSVDEAQAEQVDDDDDVTITIGSDSRSNLEIIGRSFALQLNLTQSLVSTESSNSESTGNKK